MQTGSHDHHVSNPAWVSGAKNFPCTTCHYLYNHNQSNFVDGGVWNDTNVPANGACYRVSAVDVYGQEGAPSADVCYTPAAPAQARASS